ncbi:MAG TPA: glycosyltransferase family 4 protein [Terracidiphilus sp.]|jgi:glycosyltransferase involved in cell wall biosynthesis
MTIAPNSTKGAPQCGVGEVNCADLEVALLTGGQDVSYVYGLATTLSGRGMYVRVVGGKSVDCEEFHTSERITLVDLGGISPTAGFATKLIQLTVYYSRLLWYVTFCSPKILHTLWNSKLEYFDRTLLTFYFKLLGKRVVLTAHNVNKAKRDLHDSFLNRLTLTIQYRLSDQIFVHTETMKEELVQGFGVAPDRAKVIPFGINILVPDTELSASQAKHRLSIRTDDRTILFYGRIVPYKGLECLVEAFHHLARRDARARLIIAGEPMKGFEEYIKRIRRAIANEESSDRILCRLEFIPDHETELYFKAADVVVLPYKNIFESGVLFLAYRFGLPVIASNVGSFGAEIAKGKTGLVFESGDSAALVATMETFFKSEFYKDASNQRHRIQEYSRSHHSWQTVGDITECTYRALLKQRDNLDCGFIEATRWAKREDDQICGNADRTEIEKVETW